MEKNNKIDNGSGIVFNRDIKIKSLMRDNVPMYLRVVQIVSIFLVVMSSILSFVRALDIEFDSLLVSVVTMLAIILEYIAYRIIRNYDNSLFAMILVFIFCIGVVIFYKELISSLFYFVEKYLEHYNFNYNTDFVLNTKVNQSGMKNVSILIAVIAVFVSFIVSYIVIVKMNKGLYIVSTLVWPMLCYFVGIRPNSVYFIMYIIMSVVILVIEHAEKNPIITKQHNSNLKHQRIITDIVNTKIELTVVIFAVCMFALFNIIFSKDSYEENTYIKNLSTCMRTGMENALNNDIKLLDAFDREVGGNRDSSLSEMLNTTPVLNNGVICEGGNARYYNKNVFRIVSNEINDTLYLKQFVGLKYDRGWITKIKDKEKLNEASICDNQLAKTLNDNNINKKINYNMVGIISGEMRKNLIPTGVNEEYHIGPKGVVEYKDKNVSVVAGYEIEFKDIYKSIDRLNNSVVDNQNKDINKLYITVPKELIATVEKIKPEIDKYIEKIIKIDNESVINIEKNQKVVVRALVNYLNYNYSYTLSPGEVPQGMDPIEYFLLENKKGYCMYYAAAATAILRYYKIPTRYVEGFVVRAKDSENAKQIESDKYVEALGEYNKTKYDFNNVPLYEYNVKDTNGHAWIEVYMPSIGWIPVEVTPTQIGYGNDLNKEESAEPTNKPSPKPNVTSAPSQSDILSNNSDKSVSNKDVDKSAKGKEDEKDMDNHIKYIVIGILIILLTILCVLMCIKGSKIKSFVDKEKNFMIQNKYQYIFKTTIHILKMNGIYFSTNMNYNDFAKCIHYKYNDYSIDKIEKAIRYMLKSRYSNDAINKEEEDDIVKFYNHLVRQHNMDYKGIKRFKECNIDNYIRKV